ncbi:hypothetical protein HDU97_008937 [Phlyctochytrium planicorne]|nr:hypothetical protein HDU97_008937 [Phlyctochytrium planicorne]
MSGVGPDDTPKPPPRMSTLKRFKSVYDGQGRPSFVKSVFVETVAAEEVLERERENSTIKQPLNLLTTTPWNLTRMLVRLGPAVNAVDDVDILLSWKYPSLTAILYFVFVVLCLYPVSILILPQLTISGYIISRFYFRKPLSQEPTVEPDVVEIPASKGSAADSLPFASSIESQQYLKNLQFLQNLMGLYCDLHDTFVRASYLLDWQTNVDATRDILRAILGLIPITFAIHYFRLYKYIVLGSGTVVFFHRTKLWLAITNTIPKAVSEKLARFTTNIITSIPVPDSAVDLAPMILSQGNDTAVANFVFAELFENQRWWAGLGWTTQMLKMERPPWSDEAGEVERHSKDDISEPAPGWIWVSDDWELDKSWQNADQNGWIYS